MHNLVIYFAGEFACVGKTPQSLLWAPPRRPFLLGTLRPWAGVPDPLRGGELIRGHGPLLHAGVARSYKTGTMIDCGIYGIALK